MSAAAFRWRRRRERGNRGGSARRTRPRRQGRAIRPRPRRRCAPGSARRSSGRCWCCGCAPSPRRRAGQRRVLRRRQTARSLPTWSRNFRRNRPGRRAPRPARRCIRRPRRRVGRLDDADFRERGEPAAHPVELPAVRIGRAERGEEDRRPVRAVRRQVLAVEHQRLRRAAAHEGGGDFSAVPSHPRPPNGIRLARARAVTTATFAMSCVPLDYRTLVSLVREWSGSGAGMSGLSWARRCARLRRRRCCPASRRRCRAAI